MIIDSSVVVAILKDELEGLAFSQMLLTAASVHLSAASYLECAIVLDKARDPVRSAGLDDLLEEAKVVIEPVTATQAKIARKAYQDYGKGSGHPANLNFGDCFSYALAREKREPMLWKGEDFGHTDLRPAIGN
jgi:ribonuclease VapC